MATLGEVADWGSGGTPSRSVASYFGEGIPWLSIADLNDGPVSSAKESLTAAGVANSAAKVVPSGTLFIAMYGSIGKLGIATREFVTSQAIAFAKPKSSMVDTRYLFHYLLAQRSRLIARGRGGTQMNISQGDLKAWPIPLPSIEEQRRIADILDTADAIRSKRKAVLAHLDALRSALFVDMFGGLAATVPFGKLISDGPTNGLYKPAADYGSGSPILRIDSFDAGVIHAERWQRVRLSESETSRFGLQPGDIIINRVNALSHLGKSALVRRLEEPSVYESNMMRLRVDSGKVLPAFIVAWMQTDSYKRQVLHRAKKAINQASINQTDVRSLMLAVPTLDSQRTFADRAERIEAQRTAVKRALAADDELFASLQSRAFSGKL